MDFKLFSTFKPTGDQPQAIDRLTAVLIKGLKDQVLLGVTGSGKTFTMANIITRLNRPTLVISHNKTLAAQLYTEFRQFFPENAVHYFVSYYDYYQPEAYIPQTDTYIEKEATINEEIDRLRHAATQALLTRRDCLIVASVSCIYGLGEKANYESQSLTIKIGDKISRQQLMRELVKIQYQRDDLEFKRGTFRIRGEQLEIHLASGEEIIVLKLTGDLLDSITSCSIKPHSGWLKEFKNNNHNFLNQLTILPAKHFVTPEANMTQALQAIENELAERVEWFKKQNKLLEAERLWRKTNYDLEMLRSVGYVNGIENYSRHLTGRQPGEPPETLLDYFPKDFLLFIDESHVTLPQIRGMSAGDRSRKETLINFGFRLPSAIDNRPLNFKEFNQRLNQTIYVSATPGAYEMKRAKQIVEQIIRPTGLLDPEVEIRPTAGQIQDLIKEIEKRVNRQQRTLAITLTKRMAEELADYLMEKNIKVAYIHSEIETLERVEIIKNLQSGRYDVLVGVNLLREGLDLPEVSLVAILNADMAGFLRTETSLIQTMGRAARHLEGRVIMYADRISPAMDFAIKETERRRKIQIAYNQKYNIKPKSIVKNYQTNLKTPP